MSPVVVSIPAKTEDDLSLYIKEEEAGETDGGREETMKDPGGRRRGAERRELSPDDKEVCAPPCSSAMSASM